MTARRKALRMARRKPVTSTFLLAYIAIVVTLLLVGVKLW